MAAKATTSTLKKILTNEKYIGDALLQKTITTDFLNKKRVVNKGIVPQYYVENSHEAIIPRDLFLQVQEEMVRRARLETGTGKRRVYSGKYALSHLVYCAHCGDIFRSTLCPTLFTALTAGTFSAGLIGRSEESGFRSGAASAGSRKEKQTWTARHGPFTRRICTRRS